MKSLIEEALAKQPAPVPAHLQQYANIESPDDKELEEIVEGLKLSVKVVGCGGGGSNTITRLSEEGVVGAELIATNTDARHLLTVHAHRKILIGKKKTRGLGAGADPSIGEASAMECEEELRKAVQGAHIVFVTCGLGGGTGTGAAPVVAKYAKDQGALTIVFCTKPFQGEGKPRMLQADAGLDRLAQIADTVVVLSNEKLLQVAPKMPIDQAFKVLDEILMNSIKAIIELVTKPGLVNVDYNDLKTVMTSGGVSVMSIAETDADSNRAEEAVNELLSSPLLEYDISKATGMVIKVSGGPDLTLGEAEKVAELLLKRINPNARIIWGASVQPELAGKIRLMLVVTGVKSGQILGRTEYTAMYGGRTGPGGIEVLR